MFDRLSQFWERIQGSLFPDLEEELGPLTKKQMQIVEALEVIRIEQFLPNLRGLVGRPVKDRAAIARAFIAKSILNLPTTRALIERVESDVSLRRICGWERKSEIPDESTFSRGFAEFANTELLQLVHSEAVKKVHQGKIVGHVSRDSTSIFALEKAEPKKKKPKKMGRPKKGEECPKKPKRMDRQLEMTQQERLDDLPKACNVGAKTNSKGKKEFWTGYKLHIDTVDGDIPVSCILTSASVHDSQVAIPLAADTASKVTNLYDLMDSGYDFQQIIQFSKDLGHVPIIDRNKRSAKGKIELETESKARASINWKYPEQVRYRQRSSAERVNSRLKEEFGGRTVRVRGPAKVACHLMFGILAQMADALLNLVR